MTNLSQGANNKRIAKNTVFLYIRMLLIMIVTFYTSRIVLDVLGEEDYGIYGVVGSIVAMFGFFSSTLSATCQRYFSYELGRGNIAELVKMFKLNMSVFIVFSLIVFVFAETVGLWFVNTHLTIPHERMPAMNWVFQCAIITFIAHIAIVPYKALIIAYEKMSAFAYISILEVMLSLLAVCSLYFFGSDKLILYGVLLCLNNIAITYGYYYYCKKNFKECRYSFYWDKNRIREVVSYSGWHILGSLSVMVKNQGVNILLNMFFNPVVNAARALAFQIMVGVDSLGNNFFMAVKPQIYKLYACRDMKGLNDLIIRSSKMCFFLIFIIALPVILNTEDILSIWLKEVPDNTILFTKLVLINAIIDSINGPAIAAALSTAKIKKFEIITGGLMILNLPIAYAALSLGAAPEIAFYISIAIAILTIVIRAYILRTLVELSVYEYLIRMCIPLSLVAGVCFVLGSLCSFDFSEPLVRVIVSGFISLCITVVLFYALGLNKSERTLLRNFVLKKINYAYKQR